MRWLSLCLLVLSVACGTRPNPAACCVDEAQCSAFGIDDGPRDCASGLFCDTTGTCVASQCETSADCTTSPDGPVCIGHLCTEKCTVDDDCNGIAGAPFCGDSGECVACKTSEQCTDGSAPVCDGTSHTCRTCAADSECGNDAICLEEEGICAPDDTIRFITQSAPDTGDCTRADPCGTISFALTLPPLGARTIIHVSGNLMDTQLTIAKTVYLDGNTTKLSLAGSGDEITVNQNGNLTASGIEIDDDTPTKTAIHVNVGKVLLSRVSFSGRGGKISVDTGALDVRDSTFEQGASVTCIGGGDVAITRTTMTGATTVTSTNCDVDLSRNHLGPGNLEVFALTGGKATVTNNLILETDKFTDAAGLSKLAAGSVVSFNTFVNTSGLDGSANAISCAADTGDIVNNIFAYGSSTTINHSPTSPCNLDHNLFDTVAAGAAGPSDIVGDPSTFFVNVGAMDFHPAAGSPAIGAGDPSITTEVDIEGTPRPTSRPPDIGAFTTP